MLNKMMVAGLAVLIALATTLTSVSQPLAGGYKKITVFPREFKLRVDKVDKLVKEDTLTGQKTTIYVPNANDPVTKIITAICDVAATRPNFIEAYEFRLKDRAVAKPRNGSVRLPSGEEIDLSQIPDEAWSLVKGLDRRRLIAVTRENNMTSVFTRPFEKEAYADQKAKWEYNYVDLNPAQDTTADETEYHSSVLAFFGNFLKPPENRQISDGTWNSTASFTPFGGEPLVIPLDKLGYTKLRMGFGSPFSWGIAPEDNAVYAGFEMLGLFDVNYRAAAKPKTIFWGDDDFIRDKGPFASYQPKSMVELNVRPFSLVLRDWTFMYIGLQKFISGAADPSEVKSRKDRNDTTITYSGRVINENFFNFGFRWPFRNIFDGDAELRIDKYQGEWYGSVYLTGMDFGSMVVDLQANYRFIATEKYRTRLIAEILWGYKDFMFGDNVKIGLLGTFFQGESLRLEPVIRLSMPMDQLIRIQRDVNAELEQ